MTTVQGIATYLEEQAPLSLQAPYDNTGLQIGDPSYEVTRTLIALDVTLPVLQEAHRHNCQLVIAHHPLIFGPIKKIVQGDATAACITYAIEHKLNLYIAHTNLDRAPHGLNHYLARLLGLSSIRTLVPLDEQKLHLTAWLPTACFPNARSTLQAAGARELLTSPSQQHTSSLQDTQMVAPLQMMVPPHRKQAVTGVLHDISHHQQIAYHYQPAGCTNSAGDGAVGNLPDSMTSQEFLAYLKKQFGLNTIRYAPAAPERKISRVALCGGAGSALWPAALRAKADALVTADIKYHQFAAPSQKLMLLDIGHYESEVRVQELFYQRLSRKFANIAFIKTALDTNFVQYYT